MSFKAFRFIVFLFALLATMTTRAHGTPLQENTPAGLDFVMSNTPDLSLSKRVIETAIGVEKSYALVVGISKFEGDPSFSDLPTTSEDPLRMARYLIEEAGYDHVRVLTNAKATKARVVELMEDVYPTLLGADDRFVFYWSGHGHTIEDRFGDDQGYLLVGQSKVNQPSSLIAMNAILSWDRNLRAKQVLYILDACFSGLGGVVPMASARDIGLVQMSRPSRHILSAGTKGEMTFASDNGGVFTNVILDGMRGEAETGSTEVQDGLISVSELANYAKSKVGLIANEKNWRLPLTPQLRTIGSGNEGEYFFVFDPDWTVKSAEKALKSSDKKYTPNVNFLTKFVKHVGAMGIDQSAVTLQDCQSCPVMVPFASGSYTIGSVDSETGRDRDEKTVTFDLDAFYISKNEITIEQYEDFAFEMGRTDTGACRQSETQDATQPTFAKSWTEPGYEVSSLMPVTCINYADATAFADWMSEKTGQVYRLPTEAEWEVAARAGTHTRFAFGENLDPTEANILPNGSSLVGRMPMDVGNFAANSAGLHDMHGNVWEWTSSCYSQQLSDTYSDASMCGSHTIRGGAWDSVSRLARSANRGRQSKWRAENNLGFRLARSTD